MADKKMSGKQSPKGQIDLEDFIAGADQTGAAPKVSAKPATRAVGRPPMSDKEVRNKSLQIKLTQAEHDALSKEAGHVPLSTYARIMMQEKGII